MKFEVSVQTRGGGTTQVIQVEATSLDKAKQAAVSIAVAEDRARRDTSAPSRGWFAASGRQINS
jgi:hypothetical protein